LFSIADQCRKEDLSFNQPQNCSFFPKMFVNEEEKNKPNLQDLQNNNSINQGYGISSSPTSAEPHSFLKSENEKEFHIKNSEQINQNISHDTQNKIKRPPIKAKTISFPIKGEKAKINFESPG
jgi:hypothetical protein